MHALHFTFQLNKQYISIGYTFFKCCNKPSCCTLCLHYNNAVTSWFLIHAEQMWWAVYWLCLYLILRCFPLGRYLEALMINFSLIRASLWQKNTTIFFNKAFPSGLDPAGCWGELCSSPGFCCYHSTRRHKSFFNANSVDWSGSSRGSDIKMGTGR